MTYYYDGKTLAGIELTDKTTMISWTNDFFQCHRIEYIEKYDKEAYIVEDVEYLIDYAKDFMEGRGDFSGEEPGKERNTLYYKKEEEK